ncbi:MAG: SusE domain-containing protein, partial [Prevotellaceae bacterium]|nr:SusE domain-containing protein [Prevotellaceae bacterium]
MKQEKYFLVCLAMWMGFAWSCAKDEGTQDQSSAVELTAPANDAAYNLVLVEEVIFSWKSAAGASAYTLVLSKTADLSAPATKVVNGNRLPLPAADLDVMLDNLGIDYAAEAVIYWTIKPDNNANAYTEVRALKLTRLPVPVV